MVLPPDWALQDADDYLDVLKTAVPAVIREAAVDPADIIGIGVDVTACTMLPATADGTALSMLPAFRSNPHAWVKLWKHHAAQPEADRINEVAGRPGEDWLDRYGGKIRRSGSSRRPSRSSTRRRRSTPPRTASSRRPTGSSGS